MSIARSNLVIDQQSHDRSWNYVARVKRDLISRSDSISPHLLHLRIATWMKLNIDWRDEEEAVLVVQTAMFAGGTISIEVQYVGWMELTTIYITHRCFHKKMSWTVLIESI